MAWSSPWVEQLAHDLRYEEEHWEETAGQHFCTDFERYNEFLDELFGSVPASRSGGDPQDDVLKQELRRLPVRQRVIVECHYGLWYGERCDPSDTAEALGLSHEQYNELLDAAMKALRERRDPWLVANARSSQKRRLE